MKKSFFLFLSAIVFAQSIWAQSSDRHAADAWVDSVFKSLSKEERIAQLIMIRAHSNLGPDHVAQVTSLIQKYNVGGLIFFQGGPIRQANLTNYYQSIAKTPLLIAIDGEWGLGMRLDSVAKFPYQLTLGALPNDQIVYNMGKAIGEQMKRIGVHINFAPDVDINNNPNNPVIGYRSFGEDKYKVAQYAIAYMKGMRDAGIMGSAKHFPGHGDTEVDSHLDLPVISKSIAELDSLELYPFREMIKADVGSIMIAHLYIPAIDSTPNQATSLSKNNVTGLLRKQLGYKGLSFTDALEMKGVTKFFPAGEAAVQALVAGNDFVLLPEDVPAAIDAIESAIHHKRLKWNDIDNRVKRALHAKYQLGLSQPQFVDTSHLVADLNAKTDSIRTVVARQSITVIQNDHNLLPFYNYKKVAYVGIGPAASNTFSQRLQEDLKADTFLFSYQDSGWKADTLLQQISKGHYNAVIIGVQNYSMRPANNYGISPEAIRLWDSLQAYPAVTFLFGNVYAAQNFCGAKALVAMYQDDSITHRAAADFLLGRVDAEGKLPVTVCNKPYDYGIAINHLYPVGTSPQWLVIDSIVNDGLIRRAYPGCVVLALQNGQVKYHKAFGHYQFDPTSSPVTLGTLYDLASVTKVSATTVAVMKLYEEGKLDLNKTLGDYLPVAQGTNKASLTLHDILLHQAGLVPYISFYRETIDPQTGAPSSEIYSTTLKPGYSTPVARDLYIRDDWNDTLLKRIMQSPLGPRGKYVYSDNDFILLGKIVQSITGMPLDQYVKKTFYGPMGMITTGFKPFEHFGLEKVAPTEKENYFRRQLLQSYVHDEGAAMFGNVSGHAGLFSDAFDLSQLYQMLLNGGTYNGIRYLKPETIDYFTAYNSDISRRGLGFDKPEKDNAKRREPYPSALASPQTFGHTGFTGTCVWVDPKYNMVYIFLSNRVFNTRDNNLLGQLGIRGKIQDAIYKALQSEEAAEKAATTKDKSNVMK